MSLSFGESRTACHSRGRPYRFLASTWIAASRTVGSGSELKSLKRFFFHTEEEYFIQRIACLRSLASGLFIAFSIFSANTLCLRARLSRQLRRFLHPAPKRMGSAIKMASSPELYLILIGFS